MDGQSRVFPPSPERPPAGLTAPPPGYRRHAWLAVGGLLAFVLGYVGFAAYLGWSAFRLLGRLERGVEGMLPGLLSSLPALFLFLFMLRSLFFVRRGKTDELVELTPEEEPLLFAAIHRIADETRAPRPHRLYLSARVNAAVFFDLSIWNLLVPTKKNLELGLGLVNALSLDELKAVIAHELGHFSQRAMAIGRWVGVAHQVTASIVASRGVFDRVLDFLARFDLRVAWIGWLMQLFVWAIRALVDTAFRVVLLAERALSREMEFHADRIAVSVSGSDSLVHALHRLGPADAAWDEAASFAYLEARQGRPVEDLLALQTLALTERARILDQANLGSTPRRPDGAAAAAHRVFAAELAHPPRMWSTHPPNREREDHAKVLYTPSSLDPRPAWTLFTHPSTARRRVTAALFARVEALHPAQQPSGTHEERFVARTRRPHMDPRYRGVYLDRAVAAAFPDARSMSAGEPVEVPERVRAALEALYPPSMGRTLQAYREAREEQALLEGLSRGVLDAPGGVVRYRGQTHARSELPNVVAQATKRVREADGELVEHDRACRSAHLAAARLPGGGWSHHLVHLHELLHFATHAHRTLAEVASALEDAAHVATAGGQPSRRQRRRILRAAQALFERLAATWRHKGALRLPDDVERHLALRGGFGALAQPFELCAPTDAQLGEWLDAGVAWSQGALVDLRDVGEATLDALLEAEAKVGAWTLDALASAPERPPPPGAVPAAYATCLPGQERARSRELGWWSRFKLGAGLVPGIARGVAAAAILLPALVLSGVVGKVTVHAVNGLATEVIVTVDGVDAARVGPCAIATFEAPPGAVVTVSTRRADGVEVERFEATTGSAFGDDVYNVATATSLVQWTASYGSAPEEDPVLWGAPRWARATQNVLFTKPPSTVSTKGGGATRSVLTATLDQPPGFQLSIIPSKDEREAAVAAHVRHDDLSSAWLHEWMGRGAELERARPAVVARARAHPESVLLQRLLPNALPEAERAEHCASLRARQTTADGPRRVDDLYLALRCDGATPDGVAALVAAWEKAPQHLWLALAAAPELARQERWAEALSAWRTTLGAADLGSVRYHAAVEALRTQRAAEALGVAIEALAPGSLRYAGHLRPEIEILRGLERPPRPDEAPSVSMFRALAAHDFERATRLATTFQGAEKARLTLVAASAGAPAALQDRALALHVADLDGDTALFVGALRVRRGEPSADTFARSGLEADVARALPDALAAARANTKGRAALERLARLLPLRDRALVLAAGVVALEAEAPEVWRTFAEAALFPSERPALR